MYNTLMEGQRPGQTIAPFTSGEVSPASPPPSPQTVATPPVSSQQPAISDASGISWTASEFIAHQKGAGWYALLMLGAAGIAALIFLLTRDKITTGMVIFGAIAFGIFAARKPRVLQYHLDDGGLTIGQKFYPYEHFKSFSVIKDGPFSNVYLLPLKRFMPPLSVYYPPEEEQTIVGAFAAQLPLEERSADMLDQIMRRIRF